MGIFDILLRLSPTTLILRIGLARYPEPHGHVKTDLTAAVHVSSCLWLLHSITGIVFPRTLPYPRCRRIVHVVHSNKRNVSLVGFFVVV
jgi:hypothetical protein